jgi:hypothetical protein
MRFLLSMALAFLLLVALAVALMTSPAAAYRVIDAGTASCGTWIADRLEPTSNLGKDAAGRMRPATTAPSPTRHPGHGLAARPSRVAASFNRQEPHHNDGQDCDLHDDEGAQNGSDDGHG